MINLLEGTPGSGKSYEAVVHHILPALKNGRKVITNLPLRLEVFNLMFPEYVQLIDVRRKSLPILGRWDAEAAGRGESAFLLGQFDEPERLQLKGGKPWLPAPKNTPLFGSVWDFYDSWRGEGNIGPLYVIDECHVSFPKTKVQRGVFTDQQVIEWFKISRHFGADVLLITQRMPDLEESIAGLAEFHVRVRKATALGKSDHYIRKLFSGFKGGEVSTEERRYLPQYFPLYSSHTQGASVVESAASDVTPFVKKWKRGSLVFWVFLAAYSVWAFWPDSDPEPARVTAFRNDVAATPPGHYLKYDEQGRPYHSPPGSFEAQPSSPVLPSAPAPAPAADVVPEPPKTVGALDGKTVHLSGWMRHGSRYVFSFEVAKDGQRLFTTDNHQLSAAGYSYRHLSDCMGILTFDGKDSPITCDAPRLASGLETKPHVITEPSAREASSAPSDVKLVHDDVYNPHPFTAALKTDRLARTGSL